jgi:arylsulfatase A-like enzyme
MVRVLVCAMLFGLPVAAIKPNLFMILMDDYGWGNAGWHNSIETAGKREVQTPNMEALIKEGIELNQHYVFKFCSPTRSAIQSGRNPIHVNVQNVGVTYRNPDDPVAGFSAIARNMTGMAEHLRDAGYSTAMVGKWDAGMATAEHTPKGRGYQQSLIYFHHANDYWTYGGAGSCPKMARALRNESDQGWGSDQIEEGAFGGADDGMVYFQGFHFPKENTPPSLTLNDATCPSNFTIKKSTSMCGVPSAARTKPHVSNPAECCSWCSSTPFEGNGSCVGWTFHNDTGVCFNCFLTKGTTGPNLVNRTSGCVGNACANHPLPSDIIVDLWENDGPATARVRAASPQPKCQAQNNTAPWPVDGGGAIAPAAGCKYEDELFEEKVHEVIAGHNASDADRPLFLFWAPHIVHGPAQVPQDAFGLMDFIQQDTASRSTLARQIYLARVRYIDAAIGRLVASVKAKGMYANSLFVFTADNGGPLGSANNYPLKGGKHSNWQGGVRVNAWVSGGLVPAAQRGTKLDSVICGWDWYATFAFLAGADPTDHKAAKAGLPPIDSVNQWPVISGQVTSLLESPRTEVPLGSCTDADLGTGTLTALVFVAVVQGPGWVTHTSNNEHYYMHEYGWGRCRLCIIMQTCLAGHFSVPPPPHPSIPLSLYPSIPLSPDVFCQTKGRQRTTVNAVVAYLDENATTTSATAAPTFAAAAAPTPHLWKLLVGHQIPLAVWEGPKSPNGSFAGKDVADCGVPPTGTGCLYDVTADPGEHDNLMEAAALAGMAPDARLRVQAVRDTLWQKIQAHNATTFTPDRGDIDAAGSCAAVNKYGRFWGPWVV